MILLAAAAGYLLGSIPSADLLGRLRGHDLRSSGSGNPGTANALRVGGPSLAALVLAFDFAKGAAAVLAGSAIDGDPAAVAAGLAAVLGQILNPWFRFRGGKGLGVSGGVFLAAWPGGLAVLAVILAIAAAWLRSAPRAALIAVAGLVVLGLLWVAAEWPAYWGIQPGVGLVVLCAGIALMTSGKFLRQAG